MKKILKYFSTFELILYFGSILVILLSFFLTKNSNYMYLSTSLLGATAIIFVSKGNPIGQALTIAFSILYCIISFSFQYYGEMITYLGMTAPIAIISLFSWLRHPFNGNKSEVTVNKLNKKEYGTMFTLAVIVTIAFYFILKTFNTTNLILSTVSVLTSFLAAYLSLRRSPLYGIAYGLNDSILIALWILATLNNLEYLSMVICFAIFLINDMYGYLNWSKIQKKQAIHMLKIKQFEQTKI